MSAVEGEKESQKPLFQSPDGMTMRVVRPQTLQEFGEVGTALGNNEMVFLNMEEIDDHVVLRLVDMLSSTVFDKHAKMQRVGHNKYLIFPEGVVANES